MQELNQWTKTHVGYAKAEARKPKTVASIRVGVLLPNMYPEDGIKLAKASTNCARFFWRSVGVSFITEPLILQLSCESKVTIVRNTYDTIVLRSRVNLPRDRQTNRLSEAEEGREHLGVSHLSIHSNSTSS